MDKAKLKLFLIWSLSIIFVAFSLYFGFIKTSLSSLNAYGYQSYSLYYLLMIPSIVLFLSFWKIILGFNVINTFIPILIILSSFLSGPLFTLIILLFSLLIGYLAKLTISDLRLHFAVKLSIILSILSLGLLFLLPYIEVFASTEPGNDHFIIAYAILVISLINDRYFAFKTSKTSTFTTIKNAIVTFLFSFLCYIFLGGIIQFGNFFLHFPYLQNAIQSNPDLIFIELILLILIGKYTGLRLTEFIRFRKLIFKNR